MILMLRPGWMLKLGRWIQGSGMDGWCAMSAYAVLRDGDRLFLLMPRNLRRRLLLYMQGEAAVSLPARTLKFKCSQTVDSALDLCLRLGEWKGR